MDEPKRGFLKQIGRWMVVTALVMMAWAAVSVQQVHAQTAPAAGASATSRACSANPVLAPSTKSKATKKSNPPLAPEPAPACIEEKGDALEIQEFLQATVRNWQWRIGENRASEDTWAFVRYCNVEELEKYADTKVLIEAVEFTSGKAAITVRTSEIGEGYVRVQISSHFMGEGKSTDKAIAQPGSEWRLKSKGVLEEELITAVRTRYRHLA